MLYVIMMGMGCAIFHLYHSLEKTGTGLLVTLTEMRPFESIIYLTHTDAMPQVAPVDGGL
jgi:hypothetical protein